jgi:alpha-amylase
MERLGNLYHKSMRPILVTKQLIVGETGELKVTYALSNESPEPLRLRFASEWAFNLLAPSAQDRFYESNGVRLDPPQMNSSGSVVANNIRLVDEYLRFAIGISTQECNEIVRFPIESVSLSEAGFERIFQGSIIMPIWNIDLASGQQWNASMNVSFEAL